MSEQITIISDDGHLTIDMSNFHNDKKLDIIVRGILDREDPIMMF